MLRQALRYNRTIQCRSELVQAEVRRFKTTRNSQPHRDFQAFRSQTVRRRNSPPIGRNSRPDFLQSLRVRTSPRKDGAVQETQKDPTRASSKLVNLLRKGPDPAVRPPRNRETFSKPLSASQSNLQGSAQGNPGSSGPPVGLVDFFQKRLQEVKQNEPSNVDNQDGSHPASTPRMYPRPHALRPGPNRYSGNGLQNAMRDVHAAEKNTPINRTSREEISSVREVLDQSKAGETSTQPDTATAAKKEETMSPIRQYVAELQRKNQQRRDEARRSQDTKPPVPSWRRSSSLRTSSQNNSIQHQRQEGANASVGGIQPREGSLTAHEILHQKYGIRTYEEVIRDRDEAKRKIRSASQKALNNLVITLPSEDVSIADLSRILRVKMGKIVQVLEDMGESPNEVNDFMIDLDMAEMVALELKVKFERPKRRLRVTNDREQLMNRRKAVEDSEEEIATAEGSKTYQDLVPRPPVVCIMGHVDHGKTTLMDALRRRSEGRVKTKKSKKGKKAGKKSGKKDTPKDVAGTEAGGITQAISAFQVPLGNQKDSLTFLDTPGHAAFSAMRQSGSHAADIVVLVVAADDGVSAQTIEILDFYKSIVKEAEGGITMVVAMNKIDKPGIDVFESKTRIENQLLEHDIVAEGISTHSEYGSPVQLIPISAKTGEGLDDLIEGLVLQSEVMDLRADDSARAEGIVMDARVEQGLGVVVDCIVRWGSIEKGDVAVSETSSGKVRLLKDVNGKQLKKGVPSQPIRIVGFKTAPKAGDPIVCVASEQVADELVGRRLAIEERNRSKMATADPNNSFSQLIVSGRESMTSTGTEKRLERYDLSWLEETGQIRIPVVVKAGADGSVAAVRDSLKSLVEESSFDIHVDPIAEGVGMLTMGEIEMAKVSDAAVFCFDVKSQDKAVVAEAEAAGVAIHEFEVIYSLLDHAKEVFTGYLPATRFETIHGKATVQAVFSISNDKETVAGLRVLEGNLYKSFADDEKQVPVCYRIIRGGEVITPEGQDVLATSLKKFKDDVDSVRHGDECGLSLTGGVDFQEGDTIECLSFELVKVFTK